MITLATLCFVIGILTYMPANSASVNYEPIKITVNENFNVLPGRVAQELTSVNPSIVHQGANFYFNPQLLLPPGYIPSQIEALISSIKQKTESFSEIKPLEIVVEKDKILETIKSLCDPVSEYAKETLSGIVVEKENVTEIIKPLPALPATFEEEDLVEDIKITEVSIPTPTEVIVMERNEVPPPPPPIIIDEETKPIELVIIPAAPVLPPLPFDVIPPDVVVDMKIEEPIILEDSMKVFPPIPEISTGPILEPIEVPEFTIVEVTLDMPPPPPPIIIDQEPKPVNQELIVISEAPILPPPSFDIIPPDVVEEVKIEEPILLEESMEVFPRIPENSTGPILDPIGIPEFTIVEENLYMPPPSPPIMIEEEPKPVNQELIVISEAPILSPLSFDVIPPDVVEEVKIEEPILLEESMEVFPRIPEISTGPILDSIRLPEFTIVEENLYMPPPAPSIIIDQEPKPVNQELVIIPEAPVLPPLSFDLISSEVVKEVKVEEPMLLEESMEGFTPISEISTVPILEPIRVPEFIIIEENLYIPSPIIINKEPKPVNQELVGIPEALVLQPPDIITAVLTEEVNIQEPMLSEESIKEFPPISEISTGPIQQPIIVPEIPDSFELEEISEPIPCAKNVPPVIIPEHRKTLGTFTPMMKRKGFVNKLKKNLFLRSINKQTLGFPQFMFNKLLSKLIMSPNPKENEKRIAPNALFKRKCPKKIDIRSGFPKGSSKIKHLRL